MAGKVWSHFTLGASEVLQRELGPRSLRIRLPDISPKWMLVFNLISARWGYFYPDDASEILRDKKSSGNEKYESVEFHESRNVICPALTKGALWHIFPILIIPWSFQQIPETSLACPSSPFLYFLFFLDAWWADIYLLFAGWVFNSVPMTNDAIYPNVGPRV